MMKVCLYARISQPEWTEVMGVSIEQQIHQMQALADAMNWHVVEVFMEDKRYRATEPPQSGKLVKPSGQRADRPEFLRMLALVQTGEVDTILCWRDDRLMRHPRVAFRLENALSLGDQQRPGREKIQIIDATGSTIERYTLAARAQTWLEESQRRAARAKLGRIGTLEQGRWPGGYERLGYVAVKEEKQRGRRIVLADEKEVQTVQDIYEWYNQGVNLRAIRSRLLSEGRPTKRTQGDRQNDWSVEVLRSILRAEEYTGFATYRFRDGSQYQIPIPQIISKDVWQQAQERLNSYVAPATQRPRGIYLLQGIVRCGECGSGVTVGVSRYYCRTLPDGSHKRYLYNPPYHQYRCIVGHQCPERPHATPKVWRGEALDWLVWNWLVSTIDQRPEATIYQLLTRQEECASRSATLDAEIQSAWYKLQQVKEERAFYQRQAARSMISEAEFDARMAETEGAKQYWQQQIDHLTSLQQEAQEIVSRPQKTLELLQLMEAREPQLDESPEQLREMPSERRMEVMRARRTIVEALITEVIVYADGRVEVQSMLEESGVAHLVLLPPEDPRPPCPNRSCPDYEKVQDSRRPENILSAGRSEKGTLRYQCKTCGKSFGENVGTLFFRKQTPESEILEALALVARGNPVHVVSRLKEFKSDTVWSWVREAIEHREQVEALLMTKFDISREQIEALWALARRKPRSKWGDAARDAEERKP